MAAGLPVVVANAMALPHLVRPGVNGCLYQPGDAHELAACLTVLERDDVTREVMGAASLRLIADDTLAPTLDRFEDIYCAALAVPTGGRPVLAIRPAWS